MANKSIRDYINLIENVQQSSSEEFIDYNGLKMTMYINNKAKSMTIRAYDKSGNEELGEVIFTIRNNNLLYPIDLRVNERFHRQGIASSMYDFAKSHGYIIQRSQYQTISGKAFWDKHRGPSVSIWEQDIE
jgi:hypothetical protein